MLSIKHLLKGRINLQSVVARSIIWNTFQSHIVNLAIGFLILANEADSVTVDRYAISMVFFIMLSMCLNVVGYWIPYVCYHVLVSLSNFIAFALSSGHTIFVNYYSDTRLIGFGFFELAVVECYTIFFSFLISIKILDICGDEDEDGDDDYEDEKIHLQGDDVLAVNGRVLENDAVFVSSA